VRNFLVVTTTTLLLAACATCERRPVGCAAAIAIMGGSVALSAVHGGDGSRSSNCQKNPAFPAGCHPIG
jgi:hypothetical protein